ncbi:YesL family protein [Alkalicoccobacillus murimartini]|uniref:Membrane protein YesL n=1 Tax=Alkalicoccobacillus murimartini TaxID=171685 RepID=A0ABT9YDB3_9BACI|nr:DUF624 domain-containing protein [Alkalicoccobacillus murimartini]MDQ0205470.1 putative membrane protein YesL [Alkalicoccobacillus murimartini]
MNTPREQEFGAGFLFQFTNRVYWLLILNFCFVLANGLFLFFVMSLQPDLSNVIFYYLALIPSGPAIAALLYATLKLIQENEESPFRDFIHAYKVNFKDTLKFWIPIVTFLCISIVNINYLSNQSTVLSEIMTMALFMVILFLSVLTIQMFIINAKLTFKTKDLFRVAIYSSFKNIKITAGNAAIMFLFWVLLSSTSDFLLLFLGSVLAYLIMLNSRALLRSIEDQFCHKE